MGDCIQLTARRVAYPSAIEPCQLGESPTWDDEHQALWWIDILGEALYVAHPGDDNTVDFDRVEVVPLRGHRPGFIVHATTATMPDDAVAGTPLRRHAIWGSQKGLFCTFYVSSLPLYTAKQPSGRHPQRRASSRVQHCQMCRFPQSLFPLQDKRVYRFNDGKVGPDGSLWCGGMMERTHEFPRRDLRSGFLLQWNAPGSAKSLSPHTAAVESSGFSVGVPDVTVSNGLGWSPAGDVLYHIDTPTAVIRAYPYGGTPSTDGSPGVPQDVKGMREGSWVYWALPDNLKKRGAVLDGLCVDASGSVWVALAGIGEVIRLQAGETGVKGAANVSITAVVVVPQVTLSTSCCFGGADLTTLYITTARGTSKEAVTSCKEKGAGWIYAVNLRGIAKGMSASRLRVSVSRLFTSRQQHHL